ncbi:cytochrome c6 [Citrus sinensis]|nr:cytochrome c6 [Citrus sinensis]
MALLSLVTCCNNPKLRLSTKGNRKEAEMQNPAPLQSKQVKFVKSLAPPFMAAMLVLSPICNDPVSLGFFHAAVSLAQTVDIQKGASLFRQACIGCHDGGGNVIQPGATLFLKDLQRNGVDTEDEIYHVTYFGKGRMPGFGEKCTPRGQCTFGARLQDEDIKLLAQFVKSQADQGWPKIESMED